MDEELNHYQGNRELQECVGRFEDMLKSNSPIYFDVHDFERIVDHYLDNEKYTQATIAIDHAIAQHPSSGTLLYKKAQVLAESGRPGDGLTYIYKIERMEQTNPDLFILKGSILTQLGKLGKAEHAFQTALNITFGSKQEILLDIALAYESVKQYQLALNYLKQADDLNPGKPRILHEMACCYELMGNFSLSVVYYRKYLEEKPFSENGWFNLGMVYYKAENYRQAIRSFDFALVINDKSISPYLHKAEAQVKLGSYRDALETYREYLEIDDQNPMIYSYMGECHEKLEEYEQAIGHYLKAIDLDAGYHESWYGIGVSYLCLKRHSDALFYLSKAINMDRANPDYWFTLGNAYANIGSIRDAVRAYAKVEEIDPYDYEAWINHAELEFRRSGPRKAAEVLKEGYLLNHDVAIICYHLSAYYFHLKEKELCLIFFRQGLKKNSNEMHTAFRIAGKMKHDRQIITLIKKVKNNLP